MVREGPAGGVYRPSPLLTANPDVKLPVPREIPTFRDFYCFEQHVKAARSRRGLEMVPEWYEFPIFYFSNADAFVGHGQPVVKPDGWVELDFELEVAAVVAKEGRDVPLERAEEYIQGYTIINDWSLRDLQRKEMKVGLGPAKAKDFATSIGPVVVSADELADARSGKGYDLQMVARVNGVEISRANWNTIHWSFAEMIVRASRNARIRPGDVIGSGTCGTGCILELGPETLQRKLNREQGWIIPGDVVELEIDRIGVLSNRIITEAEAKAGR